MEPLNKWKIFRTSFRSHHHHHYYHRHHHYYYKDYYSSKVGKNYEDHLQARRSSRRLSTIDELDYGRPPGFEGNHLQAAAIIPTVKWECPPRFALNISEWKIVTAEESTERDDQRERELRVLEAVYPRASHTPREPHCSWDVKNERYNDRRTPLVPLIGEEEWAENIKKDDVVVNTSTTAAVNDAEACDLVGDMLIPDEEGKLMVDPNLLLERAKDPLFLQRYRDAIIRININNPTPITVDYLMSMPAPAPARAREPAETVRRARTSPPPEQRGIKRGAGAGAAASERKRNHYRERGREREREEMRVARKKEKDVEYYRRLAAPDVINKRCKYFNTSRSCRNGYRCRYRHDRPKEVWRM